MSTTKRTAGGATAVEGPAAGAHPRRRWGRRILTGLVAVVAVLLAATLLVAYVWQPPEEDAYRSPYLAQNTTRYVETDVARFHYTQTGSGPPVLLLPGGTLWLYTYRDTIPELAADHTVYAVDLPGQGYTTLNQDDFGYDLEAMAGALRSFMDAVDLPRASVVGHSWGGTVATYLAERHPERVDRLALLAAPVLDVPSSWEFRSMEFPVVGEATGKLMTRSMFEGTLDKAFARPGLPTARDVDEYWAPLSRRENREAMWTLQRNLDLARTERLLGQVRAPTLVLWGAQDRFDAPWQATELGRRIPDAAVRVVPGAGHNLHEDAPAAVNDRLGAFLQR